MPKSLVKGSFCCLTNAAEGNLCAQFIWLQVRTWNKCKWFASSPISSWCLRQLPLIPYLQGKLQTFSIPKPAAPHTVCFTCFRHLEVWHFSKCQQASVLKTLILFAMPCFLLSLSTKLVHLNSCDLGFSFGQRAVQKVAELQWTSIGAFLLRREVILLFILPFFQKTADCNWNQVAATC